MNTTIQTLLNHKTIRSYLNKPISNEIFEVLMEVANRTASSSGMQQASIIHVVDQSKKEIIAQVCKQDYVAQAPVLLIFVVDQHRNHHIAMEVSNQANQTNDVDRFFQGFTDAALMAQSVVTAAESLGLGTT
ncbi:MAG: nitroreductase family protein, partial [Erysipelothrix sp.]|nr:nitroreductase family protein [Erysipelothrix sp.]